MGRDDQQHANTVRMSQANTMVCQRCGVCCQKGGPSLHVEDRPLIEKGYISADNLVTLRRGELAADNVKGTLAPLTEEIIKIKGQGGRWTCRFYDAQDRSCRVYAHRPLECRVLNCRDTRQIERIYATQRLNREDLLASLSGLWDLIDAHEQRCSHAHLSARVYEGRRMGNPSAQEEAILETLRYDAHVRQLVVENGRLAAGLLDFVFGRPLSQTIRTLGVALVKQDRTYRLVWSMNATHDAICPESGTTNRAARE